jgi:alanyl-tRNA synthetase
MMTGSEIRERFLTFFEGKGHARVTSSSLIPKDDPTLLFTNAGMVPFKNSFLGLEDRGYKKAASSQKCVRAGGKHNDLENVGVTARHHTFFEMLGNFSFGDYFKKEAITWAWEFLTEHLELPKEKLWITVYKDDDEARNIWRDEMKIPSDRIVPMGEKSNFWMMGETGPCGPCSEILYDQGEGTGCGSPDCDIHCDCDRHLEIWNLVFTQYDRDASGKLTPLPNPNIDTGMGLERLTAVVQGVTSNYDTDLFREIIRHIEQISHHQYGSQKEKDISIRVIADHSRAVTFLIGDGILPSNEGRGYVLRRILRRAARHGKLLGLSFPFLHDAAGVVIDEMKQIYPDLVEKKSFIQKVILSEEQRFGETLDSGLKILQEEVAALKEAGKTIIPGEIVFKLYDTYGFPTDLTADIVKENGFSLAMDDFEKAMALQKEKARESWKGSGEEAVSQIYQQLSVEGKKTRFTGYEGITEGHGRVLAILKEGTLSNILHEGETGELILDATPFYGEVGGQIGDTGTMTNNGMLLQVTDTRRPLQDLITHIVTVTKGTVKMGDALALKVDGDTRRAIEANHSGTHLLQAALKAVLGDHVKQSGSLVTAERLRFDFTHFSRIEDHDLLQVERLCNGFIRANLPVDTTVMPLEDAVKTGATAVFDEKYSDEVRVVKMGPASMELCGGTHVRRTGDIGLVKIIHESAIAAGVRRIEAAAGRGALRHCQKMEEELKKAAMLFRAAPLEVSERVEKVLKHQKELEREIEQLKDKLSSQNSSDLLSQKKEIKGVTVLSVRVDAPDAKTLRTLGDKLRDSLSSGIILLGSASGDKALLLCLVSKDLAGRFHAGNLIREIAPVVGGNGGGRPDMAQAGGTNPENLSEALAKLETLL